MVRLSRVCVFASLWLVAQPARAYLIDLNDARAVDPGTVELELQPAGYYQTLLGEEEHYVIAPSAQLYLGLAEGWDVLYVTRGYALLDEPDGEPAYTLREQFIGVRRVLVAGAYNDEDLEGPSLAVQAGAFLPGAGAEPGVGASLALLFAWQTDLGALHANVWFNYTQDETFNSFGSLAVEGPPDWPVRPVAELYVEVEDDEPFVSGLIGAVADVSDEFAVQGGVRVGAWQDYAELEVRLSTWVYWDAFSAGDEDSPDELSASSSARRAQEPRSRFAAGEAGR